MTSAKGRVLLTGATGFIGRYCVPALLGRGFEVHAVTSRPPPDDEAGATWHRFDLLDQASCWAAVDAIAPTHVLHLAWIAKPGVFWSSAENLRWLAAGVSLLEASAAARARVVVAGTCAEYASGDAACSEGKTPLRPDTVYGHAKAAVYHAFEALRAGSGLNGAWGRLFFPYGPDEPPGRLIPGAIESMLLRRELACTDGLQSRDFIYVDDVAEALCVLLASDAGGAFNIGTGVPTQLRSVIASIASRLEGADLVRFGARLRPASDPDFVVADMTRMRREVGWSATTSLDEGLDRTVSYWRGRLGTQASLA